MEPMSTNTTVAEHNIDRLILMCMRRGLKAMPSLDPKEIKMGALTNRGMVRLQILHSPGNAFGEFNACYCYDADKGGNFTRAAFDLFENNADLIPVERFFSFFDKDIEGHKDKVLETVI